MGYKRLNQYRNASAVMAAPQKRKFNLVKGLKSCVNDINDYFGLETKGDQLFYYSCLLFMVIVTIFTTAVVY